MPAASPGGAAGAGGTGGPGEPFIPQGGVSSLFGPRNGIVGALPDLAVPILVVGIPALVLLLVLLAQAGAALAWAPLARRRLGGFGLLRRR